VLASRRTVRPIDEAIRAARETTARDLARRLPVPDRNDELRDTHGRAQRSVRARSTTASARSAVRGRRLARAAHAARGELPPSSRSRSASPRTTDEWGKTITRRPRSHEMRRLARVVEGPARTRARRCGRAGHARGSARRRLRRFGGRAARVVGGAQQDLAGRARRQRSPIRVLGNAVTLETAIRNLVVNAIAATPPGGEVRVGLDSGPQAIVITVDDNGPGARRRSGEAVRAVLAQAVSRASVSVSA